MTKVMSDRSATVPYQLYQYVPNLVLAVMAIVIFALLTIIHCYRIYRTRMWFCVPFLIGGIFETVGYVGRSLGHSNPQSKTPYIIQSLLILVAPALFAATIYMSLGRLMRTAQSEKHSLIPARWLTKLFVLGDVLSFFIQGGGGGIMASNQSKTKLSENIILGGLFFQILIFGIFILVLTIIHLRMRKDLTIVSRNKDWRWEQTLFVLYTVSALIMIRNIVRVVEYVSGREGPLLRVEWPIYVFDALLMAATMVVFSFGCPIVIRTPVRLAEEDVELSSARARTTCEDSKQEPHVSIWKD